MRLKRKPYAYGKPIDRFWSKVNKTETCWLWNGALTNGYGFFSVKLKNYRAHRWYYEYLNGKINSSKRILCHKCDIRHCVNPDHLFLGSYKDNTHDAINKGRLILPKPWSHCSRGHKLSGDNLRIYHYKNKTCRACVLCNRINQANYRKRKLNNEIQMEDPGTI